MKRKDKTTGEVILQVARKTFTKKGLSGARMQDIADAAGINKALLHYYYGTKEKLFTLVVEQEFGKLFSNLAAVIAADLPLFEKIERVVQLDIERLSQFPDLPLFVINEISRDPSLFVKRFKAMHETGAMESFQQQVAAEVSKGTIRPISAEQLLINIQALSIFPFVARTMVKKAFRKSEKEYAEMMRGRKREVAAFIIAAIKK